MTGIAMVVLGAVLGADTPVPITTPPKWQAPQFGVAVVNDKGGIEVDYTEASPVWKSRMLSKTFQVREGDQWKVVSETTEQKFRIQETKELVEAREAHHFRVFRNGGELDKKTCREELKQPRRVVFVESRQFGADWPNEFYLDLLAKDTLVVLLDILKTPEVKVDPAKMEKPPAPPAKPVAIPPEDRVGPDGLYWRESLSLLRDRESGTGQPGPGLFLQCEPDLGLLFVDLGERPDVTREGWGGPQLAGRDGTLTWFGHQTGDGRARATPIAFGVYGKAGTKTPCFLSVIDPKTKPRLVLTEDRAKAAFWDITTEKTWSTKGDPKGEGTGDSEHTIGYVQMADSGLWLALSPEPIYQIRRYGPGAEQRKTFECRLLTVSPKKECLFHYNRHWSPRN